MDEKLSYLILDLYDEAQNCPVSEFAGRSLDKIRKLLKFDSAGIASFAAGPDGAVNANAAYVYKQPLEKITYRQGNIPTGQILPNGSVISRDPMIAACWPDRGRSRITPLADMAADEELKNYNRKFDTIQILTIALKNRSYSKADYISLWRAGSKNSFESKDQKLADFLLPHLHKAIELNKKIVDPQDRGHAVLFCSKDGFIHFIDDTIIRMLQEEWNAWTPPILPRHFLDSLMQSGTRQYVGRAIIASAETMVDVIVIQIARNPVGSMLTRAEFQVALWASEGMSYKEIARAQGVSPATVRNQLHNVYNKTGLTGKVELANMLAGMSAATGGLHRMG